MELDIGPARTVVACLLAFVGYYLGAKVGFALAIDVTAQVKANVERRQQREELAHLSRVALMGELTASVAHELNQPLTAIVSNAAAGTRMLASGSNDTEAFQELLADVNADARRAGTIVQKAFIDSCTKSKANGGPST